MLLSPTRKLPYTTPLQLSSHAIHLNTGSDNHTKTFNGNKYFALIDINQRESKSNKKGSRD